jgi:hypothetical protein
MGGNMQINESKADLDLETINKVKYSSVRLENLKQGDVFSYRGILYKASGDPYQVRFESRNTWAVDAVEFHF